MLQFIKDNRTHLEQLLHDTLHARGMTFDEYIRMMDNYSSCGYEVTLIILAEMFKMKILVVRVDFLWVSHNVAPIECDVVLVQNGNGVFYGTKATKKFYVGDVPKFDSLKGISKKSVTTSSDTPKENNNTEVNETSTPKNGNKREMFTFDLSPIEERKEADSVGDQKIQTKRLGMGGPTQKICTDVSVRPSSVTVTDIAKSVGILLRFSTPDWGSWT